MGFVLCDYFASPLLQFLFFLGSFDLKFAKKKKKNHSMRTSLPAPLDKSCMSVRNIDAICFGTSVVQWLLFALIKCFHCGSWRTWILICLPLKSVLHLAGFFFFFFFYWKGCCNHHHHHHTVLWISICPLPDFFVYRIFVTLECFKSSNKFYISQR